VDRIIVYPGAIPLDTDILSTNRNAMIALGYLAQAVLGTTTLVDGLACNPTSPATMSVTVGPGSIFQMSSIDNTAYGSIAADTTDPLYKHGINPFGSTSFTLTAPSSSGQTINYLIEASLVEADTGSTVLPYYNAANPAQPYTGPNNSAASQTTLRSQRVGLQLKAGAAANTGSQQTPAVDSGWVPLYIIQVNFGQTTVGSSSISVHPSAPFINPKLANFQSSLPTVRKRVTQATTFFVNASTGNDNNTGLASNTAFATIQAAINNLYQNYDMAGYQATIQLADGTYTAANGTSVAVFPAALLGVGQVVLQGNTSSPGNVIISASNADSIQAGSGVRLSCQGFTVQATGAPITTGAGLRVTFGAQVQVTQAVVFGACGGGHMVVEGHLAFTGNYTVSGSAPWHYCATEGGSIDVVNATITVTGTPNFTTSFAHVLLCGNISFVSANYSGAATGVFFDVQQNGVINASGRGTSYFPGNQAGTTATGGQYIG
jgi:hypothetical protein